MAPKALRAGPPRHAGREALYDVHPRTGADIEVFYADRTMETFGRCGAGWFWCSRRRGYAPTEPATGPFATRYGAYRHAVNGGSVTHASDNANADIVRTRGFRGHTGFELSI